MNILNRIFPVPSTVALPAVGVDFSDTALRFVELRLLHGRYIPHRFAEVPVPEGIMVAGRIVDIKKLTDFLVTVKQKYNLKYVRISVPESQVYSFSMPVDKKDSGDIRGAIDLVIEDNIPIASIDTIFDYHILAVTEDQIFVHVCAIAKSVSDTYYRAFTDAGIIPVSLELEAQAITRALIAPTDMDSYMFVDFGVNRTGITIVAKGSAIVTTTIDYGGKFLTQTLAKGLGISIPDAEKMKREYGLSITGPGKAAFPLLSESLGVLKDEINRRYLYWKERKDLTIALPPIKTIYLCGGHSNMVGLQEYLAQSLKLPIVVADPWKNCFSVEDVIPTIERSNALSYMTAIGLALADYIYD